jgi:large subunit ribosomal protein L27e
VACVTCGDCVFVVVIVLNGRHAGKKAVIVKTFDEGNGARKYGHCLVAGIDRSPRRVNKTLPKYKLVKNLKVKAFTKIINYNHMMPTRYGLDIDFKNVVTAEGIQDKTQRRKVKSAVRKLFQERYLQGKNKWFFTKLKF